MIKLEEDLASFLTSITLSPTLCAADRIGFIEHVYDALFRRKPDVAASEEPVGERVWDRCGFIFDKMMSEEIDVVHGADYHSYLRALLSALGYVRAREWMVVQFAQAFPSKATFLEHRESIFTCIGSNSARLIERTTTDGPADEFHVSSLLRQNAESITQISALLERTREDVRELIWHIRDLRANGANRGNSDSEQSIFEMLGLLIARTQR